MAELPPLASCGFVRVPADTPLWMRCEQCRKYDHFWLEEEGIRCRCGAAYTHARRPDGTTVPVGELRFVPFDEGPKHLGDLELDPKRLVLAVAVLALLVGVGWWWLG